MLSALLDLCPNVALAILLGCLILWVIEVANRRRPCPGPRAFPILGGAISYWRNRHRVLDWVVDMHKKYGDTWCLSIPSQPLFIFTGTPQAAEHILKTNFPNYVKGSEFSDRFQFLLGHGIFNADGEGWKQQRKTASHIFSVNNFKSNMVNVFHNNSQTLLGLLQAGKPLDMHNMFHRYTLDSIGEIAFGVNIHSLTTHVAFQTAFDYCQNQANHRFLRPYWKLQTWLNPAEWKVAGQMRTIEEFSAAVIAARHEEVKSGSVANRGDLLSLFMSRTDEDGKPYDDQYLRDVILNFTIAGRDTTAQALSWAVYSLSQNPAVEQRMCEEIDRVIGEGVVDFDKIRSLTYTQAIFSETLRLYPSVPKDLVTAVDDDVLPDGTPVKAGDWVIFCPYVLGRDERLWKDAATFRPERWLDADGKLIKENQFKYPVFKAGPRICLGQSMAMLEACSVLATIYSKFTLSLVPGQSITYKNSVTMPMLNALNMVAKPRAVAFARG